MSGEVIKKNKFANTTFYSIQYNIYVNRLLTIDIATFRVGKSCSLHQKTLICFVNSNSAIMERVAKNLHVDELNLGLTPNI